MNVKKEISQFYFAEYVVITASKQNSVVSSIFCGLLTNPEFFLDFIGEKFAVHRNDKKEKKKAFQGHFVQEQNVFAYVVCMV